MSQGDRLEHPVRNEIPTSSRVHYSKARRLSAKINEFYRTHLSVELDNTKGSVARDHLANVSRASVVTHRP